MTQPLAESLDERNPRPDPRLDAVGALAAAAAAALAYIAALSSDVLPSDGFAVVLFAAAPLLGLVALLVLSQRARDQQDAPQGWVAAGLGVSVVAMLLQLISFPAVDPGGGLLRTSGDASSALYLLFHLALPLGALLGALRSPLRLRLPFVCVGLLLAVTFAADAVPLPRLLTSDGSFTELLKALQWGSAAVMAACTLVWLRRAGRSARSLDTWVGVALSLSIYDIVLNAISARRFDAVWWSSLSMRTATYAVLAFGATLGVLRLLARWERYSDTELTRREAQLSKSLATTQDLLRAARETAETLQSALRPHELAAPPGVQVAARSRAAVTDDTGVGSSWYDTVLLPSGGLALVVGQVSGRDLGAIPIMGLVRGAARSYALEGHPPAVVLERVNAFLSSAQVGRSVALTYVELYPEDRVVTVALAGQLEPLVIQSEQAGPAPLPCRAGPALGGPAAARWQERTVLLPPDSTLVLRTRGIPAHSPPVQVPTRIGSQPQGPDELARAFLAAAEGADSEAVLAVRPAAAHRGATTRTLPVHRVSAGVARSWMADLFTLWVQAGALPDEDFVTDRAEVAELLVTELVSNAVRHSDLSIALHARLTDRTLRLEVADTSHRMPVLRQAGRDDTAGRGLFLVENLSRDWGFELTPTGKTVWFELDVLDQQQPEEEFDEEMLLAAFSDADDSS